MPQRPENLRDVPLEDLKAHPEMVIDLLSGDQDVSVVLQKRGETVRMGAMKTYSKDAVRIGAEARTEYAAMKRRGYGREDAVADLEAFRAELSERTE
ncbi:MAG: hypothetical protein GY719_18805 [bacterium]|nr:hypothetical protein [bacterium]